MYLFKKKLHFEFLHFVKLQNAKNAKKCYTKNYTFLMSGVGVLMFFMFLGFFGFPKPKILKLHFPDVFKHPKY